MPECVLVPDFRPHSDKLDIAKVSVLPAALLTCENAKMWKRAFGMIQFLGDSTFTSFESSMNLGYGSIQT